MGLELAQSEIQEILFNRKKKLFHCERDQMLEQVFQRGYKISVLERDSKPAGHSPEQPAVGGPALSRGLN